MVSGALLFVLGFTAVFVCEGLLFGELGATIREHPLTIERVLGVITILMGIVFLGGIPFLQREFRVHNTPRAGLIGAPLLGVVFGLAWAPCLTPTLTAVNVLAYTQGSAGRGAFLQVCYCIGLGVPFVLVALGFGWVTGALGFIRRHRRAVSQVGGVVLIAIGVLLVTGTWDHWMNLLRSEVGTGGVGSDL
jgi:cytochrome c-type biogenesis protein